jgi:hypothetical protein
VTVELLAARLGSDPLVRYALLAAAILALASLGGGWARGGPRALRRPSAWAALAAAVLAATALAAAGDRIGGALTGGPEGAWPLEGARRWPLWLLALGYGPSLGALAGLAFAAVEGAQSGLRAGEAVLVLELATIGWIAIAPSPRRSRWAAPLAVLLGWGLADVTLGLALRAADGAAAPDALLVPGGLPAAVALGALALALPGPRWWRRAAPGAAPGVTGAAPEVERRLPAPLRRARRRRRRLARPRRPGPLRRAARPARRLAPPPEPAALGDGRDGARPRAGPPG